jgi:hypothetical protein
LTPVTDINVTTKDYDKISRDIDAASAAQNDTKSVLLIHYCKRATRLSEFVIDFKT